MEVIWKCMEVLSDRQTDRQTDPQKERQNRN
jgi:hypothetical protein